MAIEIERKFLVQQDRLPPLTDGVDIVQGYIPTSNATSVRIRIAGEQGFLTIKQRTTGITRKEHEFAIPLQDAREMIGEMCNDLTIEKTRYLIHQDRLTWEIDVFKGANAGLVIAELELDSEDQPFERPAWLGEEVTLDPRYSNSSLLLQPHTTW
ncbi:MAG: hypothetical protein RLZZ385_360 [Pseudomonadota bacterium]|jgi:CYTH domain-containing protein